MAVACSYPGVAGASVTHEVAATLRGRIAQGELRPGERLPSERTLAGQLKVSRVTVVRALARLRLEGLVATRHGSGTFVAATDRLLATIAARSPQPWQPCASCRSATGGHGAGRRG